MKRLVTFLFIGFMCSCEYTMDAWTEDVQGDRNKDLVINVKSSSTVTSSITVFMQNKVSGKIAMYSSYVNDQGKFNILLPPGTYTSYCVSNANNASAWHFAEEDALADIYYEPENVPEDIAIGNQGDVIVAEGSVNSTNFNLVRRVAKLRVIINNFPEGLNDLKINITDLPSKIYLIPKSSTRGSVTVDCSLPDAQNQSIVEFLVSPPVSEDDAKLYLVSKSLQLMTAEFPIASIKANHVTELTVNLSETVDPKEIVIAENTEEWVENPITDSIDVEIPNGQCGTFVSANNMVINPSFEDSSDAGDEPAIEWKYDSGGDLNITDIVTGTTNSGNNALELSEKTYVYQDIPITGGMCYQLGMFVSAPTEGAKWKWIGTWYKGSTGLSSYLIESEEYQGVTNGYIDIFNGGIFRAPSSATKLRLELRNYTGSTNIYLDDVSVKVVN